MGVTRFRPAGGRRQSGYAAGCRANSEVFSRDGLATVPNSARSASKGFLPWPLLALRTGITFSSLLTHRKVSSQPRERHARHAPTSSAGQVRFESEKRRKTYLPVPVREV